MFLLLLEKSHSLYQLLALHGLKWLAGVVVAEVGVPRSGALSACVCGGVGKGVELGGHYIAVFEFAGSP